MSTSSVILIGHDDVAHLNWRLLIFLKVEYLITTKRRLLLCLLLLQCNQFLLDYKINIENGYSGVKCNHPYIVQ